MGAGIFLLVLGAILMFAVRGEAPGVDIQTVGLILAIAGGLILWQARKGATRERELTVTDDLSDPAKPVRIVRETVVEQDPFEHLQGDELSDPALLAQADETRAHLPSEAPRNQP